MSDWLKITSMNDLDHLVRSTEEGLPDNHVITIRERRISVDFPTLIQNNIKTDTVSLDLDSEWDGITPIIIFGSEDNPISVLYENGPTVIPSGVMKDSGFVDLSVMGYDETGTIRLVTAEAPEMFKVIKSGLFDGVIPEEDAVDLLAQLVNTAKEASDILQECEDKLSKITSLPEITEEEEGKVLKVENGEPKWSESGSTSIKLGSGLIFDETGAVSVDVASEAQEDNTRPISSGAVYTIVGNVDALLQTI